MAELQPAVARSVSWLLANQYRESHRQQILRTALMSLLLRTAATHPDPNLRGAFLEIDFRHKPTYLGPHSKAVIHRDLGTSFALPALAAYDEYYARLADE